MKKLNKVLILGVAVASVLTSGMFLSACKKKPVETPITIQTEEGVVLSRYKHETSWTVSNFSHDMTITIPDEYNEIPVTKIRNGAKVPVEARTVTVGKNITLLSPGLFEESVHLTRLDYNAVDAQIYDDQSGQIVPIFSNKTGSELEGFILNIGEEVEKIPDNFMVATESIGNIINNGQLRPYYIMPNLIEINFAENAILKEIGAYAFVACNKINQTLELPETVESIGDYAFAFSGVSGVLNLTENLNIIGASAFWNSNITRVEINSNISTIWSQAFEATTMQGIVINNAEFASSDSIVLFTEESSYPNYYIIKNIALNANFTANKDYQGDVTIGGVEYYHYK